MKDGLVLNRKIFTDTSTIGELFLNAEFLCSTLEDTVRNHKIPGETAIPAGDYEIIINLSNRFNRLMPLLLNVPYYKGVRLHNGNTSADTLGCILVGEYDSKTPNFIGNSRVTYEEVFPKIQQVLEKDRLWIHVYGGYQASDFQSLQK